MVVDGTNPDLNFCLILPTRWFGGSLYPTDVLYLKFEARNNQEDTYFNVDHKVDVMICVGTGSPTCSTQKGLALSKGQGGDKHKFELKITHSLGSAAGPYQIIIQKMQILSHTLIDLEVEMRRPSITSAATPSILNEVIIYRTPGKMTFFSKQGMCLLFGLFQSTHGLICWFCFPQDERRQSL